ncbi:MULTISPECIES: MotA/TolQ/ExbB proton channel family protein [unclassified Coleofasciculus]|uniref:MotA/TolQ/ExbB proton channel family protein n=1 Tax=unclassified Coleofasciculus TaxID=2692782 RepID=UPI001881543A|nr:MULTISPECIES: MotA/TolQ/ExbB proton channel family protein [unclassified Coleofasciculus]MBE9125228.1 MotA/TolQ/ExbB proton channel family protein [Coleofasciculus sp. LEGE 07081]MBE9148419.1 MotA/TolQ/ExbB proton channel family protein [Coleofasciculus sp. LEGE 07092]
MQVNSFFSAGGVVMWPLLGFSVLGIALTAERAAFWFRVNRRQRRLVRDVLSLYRRDPEDALKTLQPNADLPIARIFLAALELEQPTPEEFRLALESEAQAELPVLKRFNVAFETIIGLSPMLGLLGTVLGLITSFASLRVGDIGGSESTGVTGGISEALVSTAAGLVVAMFALMVSNTFRGFYLRQIALIQEYGGQLELLYRRRYEANNKGDLEYASTR